MTVPAVTGREQVARCPTKIVLFLAARCRQQLGFKPPALSPRRDSSRETGSGPGPRAARRAPETRAAAGGETLPTPGRHSPRQTLPHRLGFRVLGSGALTAHDPAKKVHLAARPPASPAPPRKKRRQRPLRPQGPAPTPARDTPRPQAQPAAPLCPEAAAAADPAAHARGRGVTWRPGGRRRKGSAGPRPLCGPRPLRRPRPHPRPAPRA